VGWLEVGPDGDVQTSDASFPSHEIGLCLRDSCIDFRHHREAAARGLGM